jgi:tight adherence protein B
LAAIAVALCCLCLPATGLAAGSIGATLGASTFPARAVVLSVPQHTSVTARNLNLYENGQRVTNAVVAPLSNARANDFGVVIAIDISGSMKGTSIHRAIAAARAIAALRTGNEQLGVILFNRHTQVLLPLTSDQAAINQALSTVPRPNGGTAIYNAMSLALQQLGQAKIVAGSVILLSDGTDNGSTLSESQVAAQARAAHITLNTIGIRSSYFSPSSLSALARDGGGQFQAVYSGELTQVFTSIMTQLNQRYIVHYGSNAAPGHPVTLTVSVTGVPGTAQLSYDAPAAPKLIANRPKPKSFWVSATALVAFALGAALLVALALVALIGPRRRHGALRRRVAEFTAAPAAPVPAAGAALEEGKPAPKFQALERVLSQTRWWPRFSEQVDIARLNQSPVELVLVTAMATIAGAVVFATIVGGVAVVVALLLGPLALRTLVRQRVNKQQRLFGEQLASQLEELASVMRAGHGLVAGLNATLRAADEPSRTEWGLVLADEQLGLPLETAMKSLAVRMKSPDVEQVALVAALHHRTGGNMAEVLDRVAEGVRERAELRRELHALTSQARLSRWIVTLLPIVLVIVISLISPSYMRPLFHTRTGVIVLIVAALLVTAGSFVMKRMTDIKV